MSWKHKSFQMSKMSSGFSSFSCYAPIIFVIFHRALWKGAGFITCFYWAMNRVKHCCSVLIFVYHIQMIEREGDFMSACWLVGIIGKLFLKLCHQRRLMATLQVIVLTVLSQQPARYYASGCFYPPSTKSWYCLMNILTLQSSGVITLTNIVTTQETHLVE